MRWLHARFSGLEASSHMRFWAVSITATSESSFWYTQAGYDRKPERPLDCPSTDRSLRLATEATIYRSRSGSRVWRYRHPAASSNGYTGSTDLATITMTKRVFGEAHWFDPTGLS